MKYALLAATLLAGCWRDGPVEHWQARRHADKTLAEASQAIAEAEAFIAAEEARWEKIPAPKPEDKP